MTTTTEFQAIAGQCDRLADVLTDLNRYLGDLADGLRVSVSMLTDRSIVHLWAPTPAGGQLRGSQWHKIVNRMTDLFGAGLITRNTVVVESRHQTPFAVEINVHVYQNDSNRAKETTLEAVLA